MNTSILTHIKKISVILAATVAAISVSAEVIADFNADFNNPSTGDGWKYQWNPAGVPIGKHADYVDLKSPGNKHRLVVDPKKMPAKDNDLPNAKWLQARKGAIAPGNPAAKSTDKLDHYVIISYTLQPGEGGLISIADSHIKRKFDTGVSPIKVYVNDDLVLSGTSADTKASIIDHTIGELKEGDTVYIAYGPSEDAATSAEFQFKLVKK